FFSSRRRHTRSKRDWSSDVCSSDLVVSLGQRIDLRTPARAKGVVARPSVHVGELAFCVLHRPDDQCNAEEHLEEEVVEARVGERSEERRVGKECRSRWSRDHKKYKR